jgi:DNA-binding response OmpR family regulator
VDDEPKLRNILARVLNERGFEVETAINGRQALDMIPEFEPHLVIADIAMPEMDGFELCKRIRSDDRFGTLRFIFLTAKDAREDEIEGLSLGADDYITKPFDVDKLLARVEARLRWLDTAQDVARQMDTSCIIEGGLGSRNLIDILQILEMSQKTGELMVEADSKKARVNLSGGVIVFAESGNAQGKMAVYEALTWIEGRFCFHPQDAVSGKDHLPITPLLLEWARIADEIARENPQDSDSIIDDFINYIKDRESDK